MARSDVQQKLATAPAIVPLKALQRHIAEQIGYLEALDACIEQLQAIEQCSLRHRQEMKGTVGHNVSQALNPLVEYLAKEHLDECN